MIVTANHWFGNHPTTPISSWADWWFRVVLPAALRRGVTLQGLDDGPPVVAQVLQGNWVVRCPCQGEEYAWEEGLFVCQSCFNAQAGHRILHSRFPEERVRIEALLDLRPLPNRGFLEGETVADLERENIEHGLPVIGGAEAERQKEQVSWLG